MDEFSFAQSSISSGRVRHNGYIKVQCCGRAFPRRRHCHFQHTALPALLSIHVAFTFLEGIEEASIALFDCYSTICRFLEHFFPRARQNMYSILQRLGSLFDTHRCVHNDPIQQYMTTVPKFAAEFGIWRPVLVRMAIKRTIQVCVVNASFRRRSLRVSAMPLP